jgi:hypothetical protein
MHGGDVFNNQKILCYNNIMRFISVLWIFFYFSGSLVCGSMNPSCCNQKSAPEKRKSCHSQESGQPARSAFDLCCCDVSADVPKTHLDVFAKKTFTLFSFYFSADTEVSSAEMFRFFRYLHTFLGPPGPHIQQNFPYAVFSALAPPITL